MNRNPRANGKFTRGLGTSQMSLGVYILGWAAEEVKEFIVALGGSYYLQMIIIGFLGETLWDCMQICPPPPPARPPWPPLSAPKNSYPF